MICRTSSHLLYGRASESASCFSLLRGSSPDYYQSDTLRILCQLLSVNLFFASATIVPGAMFYRNKEFKFIAIRSFVIQISAGAAAVTAALCGAGLYALIINPIVSSVLIFVISFQRYPQRLRFTLGLTVLRKIFSYSAYQFLFNVINYFSRNLDKTADW